MRKYGRWLCLLLVCGIAAGLLAMPVFAEVDHPEDGDAAVVTTAVSFPDVPSGASYAEAVRALNELGIITGDERGYFNPNKTITRAEAATIICRLMGVEDEAKAMKNQVFTDVPSDHWAVGYVAKAVELGIVNGYGNGKFGPSDSVTYEQMVKMLVCACGLEEDASEAGGWPNGYIKTANAMGMTESITHTQKAPVNRSVVAQLVYNIIP